MTYLWIALAVATFLLAVLLGLRWADSHNDELTWRELINQAGVSANRYDPDMVRSLPDPAQRYFNFSIAPGTPLVPAVELVMHGELGLGSIDDPRYSPMSAHQILAPPHGLVWRIRAGAISGSDGATSSMSWTRFWLFGLIPVVRVSDDQDHHRSAFGRVVAEGAFWTPAMLLPGNEVRWEAVDTETARAIVTYAGFEQSVDLTVAPNGQPEHIVIPRWSNENPAREYRFQPFGGYLRNFRKFGGYTLPTSVEGGNHFGTDQYFPFYKAQVTEIRLLGEPQP
jgi:hypothetical protein